MFVFYFGDTTMWQSEQLMYWYGSYRKIHRNHKVITNNNAANLNNKNLDEKVIERYGQDIGQFKIRY